MQNIRTLFLLAIFIHLSSATIICPPEDNCLCLPGQHFEFQCPKNYDNNGFIIHLIEHRRIQIDCAFGLPQFNINQLPNVTLHRIEKFIMRFCPLPEGGFQNVLDRFMIEDVKFFQYSSAWTNRTLSKDYFKGLSFVNGLQLNGAGLEELEDDVFANTPNLTSLDLQKNKLVLTKNLFKYTPKLKTLDLSQNQIDYLPAGLFQDLVRLEVLHLWGNNLTGLDGSTFEGLPSLKSLELSGNALETLPGDAFRNLLNLVGLSLSRNRLKTLPSNVFDSNKKLEKVYLNDNRLENLPDYLFSNLAHLQIVSLRTGRLETLPENVFHGSKNIKSVILKGNRLTYLPEGLFKGLPKMEKLDVSDNRLESLGMELGPLINLKVLHLDKNMISEVNAQVFKNLMNLEELNLSKNRIRIIHSSAFCFSHNLERIDLSHNYLGSDEILELHRIINNKPLLELLDLSYNRIVSIKVKDFEPHSDKLVVDLGHNDITSVSFEDVDLITRDSFTSRSYSVINLEYNPLKCDCSNYDLSRYIRSEMQPHLKAIFDIQNIVCSNPAELQEQEFRQLQPQLLVCPIYSACPEKCDCIWRPHDSAVVVNCSSRNFSEYPLLELSRIPYNRIEMHLEGNELEAGPQQKLAYYDNITSLYLSRNKIESLTWLPPSLEVLYVDNNKLRDLPYEVLTQMNDSLLLDLALDGNPWSCDCNAVKFTRFLREQTEMDTGNIRCRGSTILLRDLNSNDLCLEWRHVYTVAIILSILLLIVAGFGVYSWCKCSRVDEYKIYDTFVSFSHKDEDFVVRDLLPVLDNNYRLCLHYPDWCLGEFAIPFMNSVQNSRRTLVVLSKNFLETLWGKTEFRIVFRQAMGERRSPFIIILYGDLDLEDLDQELNSYMMTNMCVKWGEPHFWNKIKYALPHSKGTTKSNNMDDKLKLVVPAAPPSPGSTPPVLSVLKKTLYF